MLPPRVFRCVLPARLVLGRAAEPATPVGPAAARPDREQGATPVLRCALPASLVLRPRPADARG